MNPAHKDFYYILGVSDKAEFAVIKAAYKALMMIYHPDRQAGNPEQAIKKTKDIIEAYTVLIDPVKRKKYDAQRGSKLEKTTRTTHTVVNTAIELNVTLKESEAILNILNAADTSNARFSDLFEFKNIIKDTEALFKLLNDPDT